MAIVFRDPANPADAASARDPSFVGGRDSAASKRGIASASDSKICMSRGQCNKGRSVNVTHEVLQLLDAVLGLKGRAASFTHGTHLMGALPELDSMAVVGLLAALEDRFGMVLADDEIDGQTFATVGSLVDFVQGKVAA